MSYILLKNNIIIILVILGLALYTCNFTGILFFMILPRESSLSVLSISISMRYAKLKIILGLSFV